MVVHEEDKTRTDEPHTRPGGDSVGASFFRDKKNKGGPVRSGGKELFRAPKGNGSPGGVEGKKNATRGSEFPGRVGG